MTTRSLWTPPLLAVAALAALRAASGLPAPAYVSSGVAVGDDMPALAYAGAGTLHDGMYTMVYDSYGEPFHSFWPFDRPWNSAELAPWRSANAFRTSWKPAITRREISTHMTPIDLRMGHRCEWEIPPGHASVSVPVGVACSSPHEPQGNARRVMPTSHHHPTSEEPAVPESAASASRFSSSLASQLGDAAQLVMQQMGGEAADEQADDPAAGGNLLEVRSATAAHSRRRRQVSRVGGRGASAAAAAASASSGPWGSSASAAAASAASGGRRRPAYGYRPAYYGRLPAYGRPYPGAYYG